jgi:hypothetical protein
MRQSRHPQSPSTYNPYFAAIMATLNLPKPVNTYAGEDELRSKTNGAAVNGNGTTNGAEEVEEDIGEYKPPRPSDRFKVGIIYPPREVRCECNSTNTSRRSLPPSSPQQLFPPSML